MKSPFSEKEEQSEMILPRISSRSLRVCMYMCVCEWIKSVLQLVDVVYTLRCIKNSGFLNKQIEVDSKY